MFSRICGIPSACIRCQSWLAGRIRPAGHLYVTTANPSQCRWQSVLAQSVDNDQDEPQPRHTGNDEIQESQRSSGAHESEVSLSDTKVRPKRTIYRRWRPHKAEELGVSVLGKPAEVLILPTRKRKTTRLVSERAESDETGELQKSLDSELKPVTMRDVLKNIDQFKTDLGKDKLVFSKTNWEDMKSRLSRSFTKAQLQEYLRIAMKSIQTNPGDRPANKEKRSLATDIMTSAWGWACAGSQDQPLFTGVQPTQKKLVVRAAKLAFIMLHEKRELGNLSETLDVQIDVFRNKSRIELKGTASAVENASIKIKRLVESLKESTLHVPSRLQKLLTDKRISDPLLTMLMQKHKLLIKKNLDVLTIVGPTKTSGGIVLRDLLLHYGRLYKTIPFSFYSDRHRQQATKAPFYLVDSPQWLQQDPGYYRHITINSDTRTMEEFDVDEKRDMRKSAEKMLKLDKPNQTTLSQFVVSPGSLKTEYIADLGQALFELNVLGDSTSDATQKAISAPRFFLQQAFLPQILGSKNFDVVSNTSKRQATADGKSAHPFLLRIRLQPLTQATNIPPLEVYLSGQDSDLGFRQQLEIKSVVAIIDQWEHILLLPHQPMDVLMTRKTTIDLFKSINDKAFPAYLAILKQISSYLEEAQISTRLELPPIWNIDISSLWTKKTEATTLNRQSSSSSSTAEDEPQSSKHGLLWKRSTVAYALEPPEYLDVASYAPDTMGDRYIDHLTCATDPADTPQQRQILQIKDSPLSALLSNVAPKEISRKRDSSAKQRWFRYSVDAAYDLATKFREAETSVRKSKLTDHVTGPVQ